TSVSKAITNSERAVQLIATADSALSQVSSLLNDIRGLVVEGANTGALSNEQIAANQLQIDSSLEAIDRIAQTTTFQGKTLLDGSLDFLITAGTGYSTVSDLSIDQANLGSAGAIDVEVDISAAATQAQVTGSPLATGELTIEGRTFQITAADGQTIDNVNVAIVQGAATGAAFASNTLTITLNNTDAAITGAAVAAAIDGLAEFDATVLGGTGTIDGTDAGNVNANAAQLDRVQDLVVRISGREGSEVFSFQTGTTLDQIVDAINLVSDATGVEATNNSGTLELESSEYGSKSFVDVEVISEGSLGNFEDNLSAVRDSGTDVVARVNGVQANGDGNKLSINTSTLDLSLTVADGSSTDVEFQIYGGGAVFQLGPDVVSNQQARIGIKNLNSGSLGGSAGRLYELRSGNAKSLENDAVGAGKVVEEVITKVANLRGRLGAFQRTTLESNSTALGDYLANLTEAESAIRDADFAKESAALTRAQVLVQSGTSVLAIANQNPQNVLSLLR
ncbi:MAG TPA: flagellin, partial [Pirellulaceae bacterium]|nr:flagellin [Pirellulaceae bacterium]